MAEPYLALITPLTGGAGIPTHPIAPGGGGIPAHPIYNPAYPDQSLPGSGGTAGQLPSGGNIPDQGLPGGTPVPPGVWPNPPVPPLPPELESQVVVAVHKPGQPWVIKTYPVGPSQGLPDSGAQPKG